jgi:hypothetical protein
MKLQFKDIGGKHLPLFNHWDYFLMGLGVGLIIGGIVCAWLIVSG